MTFLRLPAPPLRCRTGLQLLALASLTLGGLAAAPAAHAAIDRTQPPIEITAPDKPGDSFTFGEDPGTTDILSATVVQDRAAGTVHARVEFASSPVGQRLRLRVVLGLPQDRKCVFIGEGTAHLMTQLDIDSTRYGIWTNTEVEGLATRTVEGNVVTIQTESNPAVFSTRGWDCIHVGIETMDDDFIRITDLDELTAFAPPRVAPPVVVVPPPTNGTPIVLDTDGDGIYDTSDKCPGVAGATQTGCETVPLAKSLRLGTKRLVIDRMIARTGKACPAAVKATVTLGGKTLGKKALGTTQRGSFCHVVGVVKLKKKAKKARVVITGTGVAKVAATVVR